MNEDGRTVVVCTPDDLPAAGPSLRDTCTECLGGVWVSLQVAPVMQREHGMPVCTRCFESVRTDDHEVMVDPAQVPTLRKNGAMDVALDAMLDNGEALARGLALYTPRPKWISTQRKKRK